ncbi:MAG: hypothetical protein R3B09_03580 [Nannocystaceae bacterium]
MTRRIAPALLASTLLYACASPVDNPDDARAGWAKTTVALSSGSAAAQGGGAGQTAPEDTAFRAGSVDVGVDFKYQCANGGSIHYKGATHVASDVGSQVTFNYDAAFDGCEADGLTIDGDLTYDLAVETTDTTSSVVYTYKGELEWSGQVKGSCEIDMTGSVMTSTGSASVQYKGSICGYDAAVTLNVTY